jgi:Phasin protein
MTTTQRDKGGAKPRQRARKTDQKAQRGEKPASTKPDRADRDSMTETASPIEQAITEQATIEQAPVEEAPVELAAIEQEPVEQAMMEEAPAELAMVEHAPIEEKSENAAVDAALSGEVLPPEIRTHVAAQPLQAVGLQTIAAVYVDYARKSWVAGRMLAERFMVTRSLEETVEAQGDFARQTHANFLAHSQKLCELYAEYTRQFFRPLEALATQWTRIGRL